MKNLWKWLSRPTRLERQQSGIMQRLEALQNQLKEMQSATDKDHTAITQLKDQSQTERIHIQHWNTADSIGLIVVAVGGFVTLCLFLTNHFINILQNADAIVKWASVISAILSISVAFFMLFTERMRRTTTALTVIAGAFALQLAIYNPDDPKYHEYWDGEETITCSESETDFSKAYEKNAGDNGKILTCEPVPAGIQ